MKDLPLKPGAMMNVEIYRQLYTSAGFAWNPHRAAFLKEYGGMKIEFIRAGASNPETVEFCRKDLINAGRKYGMYELSIEFLGEELAPIGSCDNAHVYLFLTESGRLFEFADYLLLVWSEDGKDWRLAIKDLINGVEPTTFGLIE